jgi:hypothetical protein
MAKLVIHRHEMPENHGIAARRSIWNMRGIPCCGAAALMCRPVPLISGAGMNESRGAVAGSVTRG